MHDDPYRRAEWYQNLLDGVAALHDDPDSHAEWYQNIVKARVESGKRQTELRRKVKDREVESTEDERALYEHICGSENAAKEKAKSERLEAFKVDKSDGLYCYCANKSCKDQLKIVVVDQIKLSKVEEIVGKGKELFGVVPSNSTPVQTSYASGPKSGEKISVHCSYADAFEELLDLKLPEGKPKTTKAGKSSSFDECTEAYGRKVRKGTPQIISLVDENGKETCNVQISLYEIKRSSELFLVPVCSGCRLRYTVEHLAKEKESWDFEKQMLNCVNRHKL